MVARLWILMGAKTDGMRHGKASNPSLLGTASIGFAG